MNRTKKSGPALLLAASLSTLAACAAPSVDPAEPNSTVSTEVMTQLSTMAAAHQDLQSVRLRPEDGCYWYRHVGPVETTMLPLRTADGRPICTQRAAQTEG
jgi:hypothetical protein